MVKDFNKRSGDRQYFVFDTTALTDVETRKREGWGDICSGMEGILDLVAEARLKLNISCYVPYPTVYKEIEGFAKRHDCSQEVTDAIDTWLVKKTPNRYEVKIPADIFYEYVDHMRSRINRGMRVAEDAIRETSNECFHIEKGDKHSKEIRKKVDREVVGEAISKFRDKYRDALRYGILDAAPDIDVLLLSKELDAAIVGADDGIEKWAERLGLRYVQSKSFPRMIKEYLRKLDE